MALQKLQTRLRRGHHHESARYVRRDMWRDPGLVRNLPTYFVLDTEGGGDVYECESATHACAVARTKNREYYRNAPGNWTRYVACYKTQVAFRMLEFFEREVV